MKHLGLALAAASYLEACTPSTTTHPDFEHPTDRPELGDTGSVDSALKLGNLAIRGAAMGLTAPEHPFAVVAEGEDAGRVSVRVDMGNEGSDAIDSIALDWAPSCSHGSPDSVPSLYSGNVTTVGCTFSAEELASDGLSIVATYNEGLESRQSRYHVNLALSTQDCAVRPWLADAWLRKTAGFVSVDAPLGVGPYDWSGMSRALDDQGLNLPVFQGDLQDPICADASALVGSAVQMNLVQPYLDGPCDMNGDTPMLAQEWTLRSQYNMLVQQGFTLGEGCPLDSNRAPNAAQALAFLEGVWELSR